MKSWTRLIGFISIIGMLLYPWQNGGGYPVIDGVQKTGISRLLRIIDMDSSEFVKNLPYGARHSLQYVRLNLINDPIDSNLIERDADLEAALEDLIPNRGRAYSVALMDITPNRPIRYAERNATATYQPGSLGKLAVVTALMCELENVFVDSVAARWELLKNKVVRGGEFAVYDHHTIPEYDPDTKKYTRGKVNQKHTFSLYEWIDHMLSVSNNGAASIIWREAILMRVFGTKYPDLTQEEADQYFKVTDRKELRDIAENVVNEPLRHLGIGHDEWRLGSMFTRGASGIVPPKGGSVGTPRGLMKWMVALESGRVIDAPSSLEIKRLMYMTDRRIRYAKSPALDSAAVYFKSGSLYGCKAGTSCEKYKGNRMNYMNSLCIIEQPSGIRYLVALETNVLERNSAYDHMILAKRIDNLIRSLATDEPEDTSTEASLPEDNSD